MKRDTKQHAYYRQFYMMFRDWEILHELVQNLTWTHIRRILSVSSPQARDWYLKAAADNMWSTTELDRNISTQYDDLVKGEDDQPTIGVLLCTDTDSTIARYSVLHDSDQLYAAKYMTYMPTEEELRREIEHQKQFFLEQHQKQED